MKQTDIQHEKSGAGIFWVLLIVIAILPVAVTTSLGLPLPLTATVAAGYVLQLLLTGFMLLKWRVQPRDPWIWLAVLYACLQTITLIRSSATGIDIEWMDLVAVCGKLLGVIIYAGLAQALMLTEAQMRGFLRGFLWLGVVAIVANVLINASDFSSIYTVTSSYQLDFSSFFANRNQFGLFLFLSIVVHALYLHRRKLKLTNLILFAAQFGSLLLTMSRTSLIAVAVFAAAFAVLHFTKRPKFLFSLFVLGVAAVLAARYLGLIDVLRNNLIRSQSGLAGRDDLWSLGLDIWMNHSITFGVGGFTGIGIAQDQGMPTSEFHNFFIETLVGGGLVELTVLAAILVIAWSRLSKSSLDSYRRHILYASALGVAALSLAESVSLFSIGLVGTLFTVFMVTVPILYSNLKPTESGMCPPSATAQEKII